MFLLQWQNYTCHLWEAFVTQDWLSFKKIRVCKNEVWLLGVCKKWFKIFLHLPVCEFVFSCPTHLILLEGCVWAVEEIMEFGHQTPIVRFVCPHQMTLSFSHSANIELYHFGCFHPEFCVRLLFSFLLGHG